MNKLIEQVELMSKLGISPRVTIPDFWSAQFCPKIDKRLEWKQINQLNNIISIFGNEMPDDFIIKIRDMPM